MDKVKFIMKEQVEELLAGILLRKNYIMGKGVFCILTGIFAEDRPG